MYAVICECVLFVKFLFSKKWVVAWGCKLLVFFYQRWNPSLLFHFKKVFYEGIFWFLLWNKFWSESALVVIETVLFIVTNFRMFRDLEDGVRRERKQNSRSAFTSLVVVSWRGAWVSLCVWLSRFILSVYYLAYQKTWSSALYNIQSMFLAWKIRENHQNDRDMIDSLFATRSKRRRELPFLFSAEEYRFP